MDVQFISPFIIAIQRVFEKMIRTQVRVGKPRLRSDECSSHDISLFIGFSGDAVGCVVLGFPTDVARCVASAFAGKDIDRNHPRFADAIGQLANMVAGNAKTEINGANITISLPSVIAGDGHTVLQSNQAPNIVIPCETDVGPVFIVVGMQMKNVP